MASVVGIGRATRPARAALRATIRREPTARQLLTKGVVEFRVVRSAQQARLDQTIAAAPSLEAAADRILQLHGQDAVKAIKQIWPVDTGLSKDMWALVKLGKLRYAVSNPVDYSQYVHRKGQTTALVAPGGAAYERAMLMQRRVAADLAKLFGLAAQKLADLRKAQAAAFSAGTKATGALATIRRFFGG